MLKKRNTKFEIPSKTNIARFIQKIMIRIKIPRIHRKIFPPDVPDGCAGVCAFVLDRWAPEGFEVAAVREGAVGLGFGGAELVRLLDLGVGVVVG